MSRVFLAEYEMTGSLRVLKVLNVADGGFDLLRRFLQEYQLISQIRHPHVATIFDHGQTDSHAYIVMEYFPGGDSAPAPGAAAAAAGRRSATCARSPRRWWRCTRAASCIGTSSPTT